MAGESRKVVIVALAANLAITVTKFLAGLWTGSAAMMTEGVHSLVDSADQGLILWGQRRAKRPADTLHPFGYGMELYFYAFVVSLLIFTVGGAASVWEGVHHIRHPETIRDPLINYLVLLAGAVFEGISFAFGLKTFREGGPPRRNVIAAIRASKDPSLFIAVVEDAAALLGLFFAFLGVLGSSELGLAWADGAASVGIGVLLIVVALFLANETRSLLTGEAASREVSGKIRDALKAENAAVSVQELLTLQMGPSSILVAVTVDFRDGVVDDVEAAARRLIEVLRRCDPRISRVFLAPGRDQPAQTGGGPIQRSDLNG